MTKKKIITLSTVGALLIALIIGGIFLGLYLKTVKDYQDKIKNTTIGEVDISKLSDGIYTGDYDIGFIYAQVEVTVISGKITKIILLRHDNDRGTIAEDITNTVIREQSLQVEAVSGATNSSKTILKAIENALKSEPKPLE
jgi:uncharacterized protein with FMN-binding domain